jgi:predicted glycosyltransferase
MHVFYVQGGGLGHLTRTDTLIRFLNINAEDVIIITPSHFTQHFTQYTFISLSWDDTVAQWIDVISNVIKAYIVDSFYVDTFPLGIKGELIPIYKRFKAINYVYVVRVLKWEFYLSNMPELLQPTFNNTVVLETVHANHYSWIEDVSKTITKIDAPQLYITENQIPLIDTAYYLVVHSGGPKDVLQLCEKVMQALNENTTPVFVITQVAITINNPRFIVKSKVYPASQYFKHAKHIFTGAGFNLVNELKPYKEKHTIYAFNKLYDDQLFRKQQNS